MLSAHNRSTNVANAFALNKHQNRLKIWWSSWLNRWFKIGTGQYFPDLSGKNVLLVDDIFTTGSTCNEIAKVLRKAGVRRITVCTFARAVGFYTQHRTNLLENLAKKSGI
jgi:predicted amidophosphoribosyltransferase